MHPLLFRCSNFKATYKRVKSPLAEEPTSFENLHRYTKDARENKPHRHQTQCALCHRSIFFQHILAQNPLCLAFCLTCTQETYQPEPENDKLKKKRKEKHINYFKDKLQYMKCMETVYTGDTKLLIS